MSHAGAVGASGAVFLAGVAYFWYVIVPLVLGTLEQALGLNNARRKR